MKETSPQNPWKTLDVREVYFNAWIRVEEHRVINPAGGPGIYGKVSFRNRAIGIVALDEEMNTWLVGQYRYALDCFSWEIPEGGGPLDADRLDAAKRELKEETGITAGTWREVLKFHTSNSVTDEVAHVFLAEDLHFGDRQTEDTEADLVVKKVPFREALAMVQNGEITDGLSIVAIHTVARLRGL
jgi:8-oxo-dGTP pyrophosphatase MutT (NUDIX family)